MADHFWESPKHGMAAAYAKETGEELIPAGIDAAYADIVNSFHKEMEEFARKYCPKRLTEFDDLMEQAFWRYH